MRKHPVKFIAGLLIISSLLVSCGPSTLSPTSTPTMSVTSTPLPASSVQPSHTPTPPPTHTTSTPNPTNTPRPTATPSAIVNLSDIASVNISGVQQPLLSSNGRLAVILNETLFIETEAGSGEFKEIDRYVQTAVWAPDGTKLVYGLRFKAEYSNVLNDYRLWLPDSQTSKSLTELIDNFPAPPYPDYGYWASEKIRWTPDGNSFFLLDLIEDGTSALVNLSQHRMLSLEQSFSQTRIWPVSSRQYLRQVHCGAPCEGLSAYDYQGQKLWQLPWATAGLYAFMPDAKILINIGRVDVDTPSASVDEIDLITGQVTVIWEKPIKSQAETDYFSYWSPTVSPNERFVSFNFGGGFIGTQSGALHIIDRQGRTYAEIENSWILAWHPANVPTIVEELGAEQSQLLYLPLDGQDKIVIAPSDHVSFEDGRWSPDGGALVYSVFDKTQSISSLYLWKLEMSQPRLISSHTGQKVFGHLLWTLDSQNLYFTLGENFDYRQRCYLCSSLWQYNLVTNEMTLIANSGR